MRCNQSLFLARCFSGESENNAWVIHSSETTAVPVPHYHSNAEEANNWIRRHATQTWATKILIYSPDTDVYNIGLGLNQMLRQYIIQLNVPHAQKSRYLHINNLQEALNNDPDLAALPRDKVGMIMQTLYIATGCDFVSYFKRSNYSSGNRKPPALLSVWQSALGMCIIFDLYT